MTNAEANTGAAVAPQGVPVAPERAASKKDARRKKNASKGQKTAKVAQRKKAKAENETADSGRTPAVPRRESEGAKILEMIRRPKGATLAEIMKATDWQAHSVRGFISTASKKYGLRIDSSKNDAGDRLYRIEK
jgi:hypothetical protein